MEARQPASKSWLYQELGAFDITYLLCAIVSSSIKLGKCNTYPLELLGELTELTFKVFRAVKGTQPCTNFCYYYFIIIIRMYGGLCHA